IAGGAATELMVLHDNSGELGWVPALVLVVGGAAALALATGLPARARAIAVAAALGALLLAPGAWAFQTLGHAANGTFPAGGPAGPVRSPRRALTSPRAAGSRGARAR